MARKKSPSGAPPSDEFAVSFPAMRGQQAAREFFVIMCPLRYLPRLFMFDETDVPPQLRAQRALNKSRLPGLVSYLLENRDNYVFSALTASVDGAMTFEAHDGGVHGDRLGVLHIAMDSRFLINDGQHRRAAIEEAMKADPSLGEETIPIVIFSDEGLARSQQMFADLNRHAVRPAKSIGVLYDHRDDDSGIARLVVINSDFYRSVVEMERSTLSPRSRKLFTLSALYGATQSLLTGMQFADVSEAADAARAYWEMVADQFPEWQAVRKGNMSAGEVRQEFIHSHGIALAAIGRVGNTLFCDNSKADSWEPYISRLSTIDWTRANSGLWEGRAMIGGRVSKASMNVALTTNALRLHLGLPLSADEQRVEDAYQRGKR